METQENPQQLEQIWKQQVPWLQDIYLWSEDELLYPAVEWIDISAPCLEKEETWIECRKESWEIQNRASLLRAQKLLQNGYIHEAHFTVLSDLPPLRSNILELDFSPYGIQEFFLRRNLLYKTEQLNAPQNGGQALLGRTLKALSFLPAVYLQSFLADINPENTSLSDESRQQVENSNVVLNRSRKFKPYSKKKLIQTGKFISSYQEKSKSYFASNKQKRPNHRLYSRSFALLQELLTQNQCRIESPLQMLSLQMETYIPASIQ